MGYILIRAIRWFARIIIYLLLGRAVLSWFAQNPYSSLGRAYRFLVNLTEPIVGPCRKLLSRWNTGALDFSVLLALILVEIVESVLVRIVYLIFFT